MAVSSNNVLPRDQESRGDEEIWEKIQESQERHLIPLKEDLADWLNRMLGVDNVTADNFLTVLDNGVIVCKLANLFHDRSRDLLASGSSDSPFTSWPNKRKHPRLKGIPKFEFKWWENAKSHSFFARDNVVNFLRWCKQLGINPAVLFETDGLVMHKEPRSVVLCLLELGRIAARYGMDAPVLVQMEREIDEQESVQSADSGCSSSCTTSPPRSYPNSHNGDCLDETLLSCGGGGSTSSNSSNVDHESWSDRSSNPGTSELDETRSRGDAESIVSISSNVESISSNVESISLHVESNPESLGEVDSVDGDVKLVPVIETIPVMVLDAAGKSHPGKPVVPSELDKKVMQITSKCCNNVQVQRIAEGLYCIAGKTVFIRLLNGRHMMVRVGGGWDTLEHFLYRHDPCHQSEAVMEQTRAAITSANQAPPTWSGVSTPHKTPSKIGLNQRRESMPCLNTVGMSPGAKEPKSPAVKTPVKGTRQPLRPKGEGAVPMGRGRNVRSFSVVANLN